MNNLAFILFVFAAAIGTATAQSSDSLKSYLGQEIVVTGQYEPQSVDRSVYKVRVIPMERIQQRGATNLQSVLQTELNIRFQQDLPTGTSTMTMQGLGGQNVKVLIDGLPLVGRQSVDNSFNINQINVNSIERIELIEGPMSVIYGADALAGVINIITKKSTDGKLDVNARLHEESIGKEYGVDKGIHNEGVGAGYTKGKFNVRADIARNFNGGFKGDSIGRAEMWHPKTQYLGNALFGYTSDRSRIYYRIDALNEDIYNAGNFSNGFAIDQDYISNRLMHQLQGAHTFGERLTFNGALSYTNYSRKVQATTVNESNGDVRLALTGQDITKTTGTTFRGTFQYKISNKFTLQPGLDLNYETSEGGRISPGQHGVGDYAFFLSGEWTINSRLQLRPGLRMTHNTVFNAPPATPSLNAKIKLTDRSDLRLSAARAFRAPSIRELYFNFFDTSHQIEGNPDLKPETSNSFNASYNARLFNISDNNVTTAFGGFYNDVQGMIDYGRKPNSTVTSFINISRYKSTGVTWNNTLRNKNWDLNLGFAYTGRYNQAYDDGAAGASFQWSPEVNTTTTYRTSRGGWSFTVFYKYNGKLPYPEFATDGTTVHIATMKSYSWADVSVQKELFKSLALTVGSHNLFNVTNVGSTSLASPGAHSTGATRAIGSGRGYFLSLIYTFNQ